MLRFAVAALALALVTTAGAATAKVHAKLTFDKAGYTYRNVELAITRNGARFSARVGRAYFTPPKLHVRDLDFDREPEVWVDTYTGGAHCCDESRFFHYVTARRTYAGFLHSWGNVGYRAKNIDGRDSVELVSADDRFAYVFTSFAGSFFPLQLWHLEAGRLRDVTRGFPGEVKLDAQRLWHEYSTNRNVRRDPRGVLAAWVADELLLGRGGGAWAKLEAIRKRGELGPRAALDGWPQGTSYVKALRAFLQRLGYA